VDYQTLFNMAITAVAFFGGWTLNRIYTAIDRLDNDVRNLPHEYVSKDDYRSELKEIKEQLNKIIDKLDGKADK
jgi:predicted RNA-binding protein with EMAP domain